MERMVERLDRLVLSLATLNVSAQTELPYSNYFLYIRMPVVEIAPVSLVPALSL